MSTRASLLTWFTLLACDPSADEAGPADDASPRVDTPRSPAGPTRARAEVPRRPLAIEIAAIRRGPEVVEIEVALDRALPPLDRSRPRLQVGPEIATRSRHPDGRLDRLAFLVPFEQFERMPDGAPMIVRIGPDTNEGLEQPRLDKARLEDRR